MNRLLKSMIFYYLIRPIINRTNDENIIDCPMCGECLQKYTKQGFLHIHNGDADCYGLLNVGKGGFR